MLCYWIINSKLKLILTSNLKTYSLKGTTIRRVGNARGHRPLRLDLHHLRALLHPRQLSRIPARRARELLQTTAVREWRPTLHLLGVQLLLGHVQLHHPMHPVHPPLSRLQRPGLRLIPELPMPRPAPSPLRLGVHSSHVSPQLPVHNTKHSLRSQQLPQRIHRHRQCHGNRNP